MRHRASRCFLTIAMFAAVALTATRSEALTVDSSVSFLAQGGGCAVSACLPFNDIYGLDAATPVSGSFTLDTGALTLSFDLDLVSAASFSVLSGTDGGVTSVSFSPLNYSGTVAVVNEGGGLYSVTDQLSDIVGTATPTGAGSASSINLTGLNGANTTGTCNVSGANVTCGLVFGAGVGFPVDVNGNTRYFRQTVNFSAIPEPGTALLIGLGLTGLAARRRPRPTAV